MIDRFEIIDGHSLRPDAPQILFCDGTGGSMFRADTDLELSHWRPNRTPAMYRAGTSTEICFRFLDDPQPGLWTVAVNNHVDVDGILSVYVLVCSDQAQAQRRAIVQASRIGDFWGWGEPAAQRIFQGVTRLINSGGADRAIYKEAFQRIPDFADGTDRDHAELESSLEPLRRAVDLVESGRITRREIDQRFVQYVIPVEVAGDDDERAAYVPEFNELISPKALLWPEARSRRDAERMCLVSTQRRSGWFHDLWFPGYLWADTDGLWRVPSLTYHNGMRSLYDINNPDLLVAFFELQRRSGLTGTWGLGGTSLPFGHELQPRFPLVGRFMTSDGHAAISNLPPELVAKTVAGRFL